MLFSAPVRLPQPTGHSHVHLRTGCEEEEEEKMTLENHKYGPTLSGGAPGKGFCLFESILFTCILKPS